MNLTAALKFLFRWIRGDPSIFFPGEKGRMVEVWGKLYYAYYLPVTERGVEAFQREAMATIIQQLQDGRRAFNMVYLIADGTLHGVFLLVYAPRKSRPLPLEEYGLKPLSPEEFNEIIRDFLGIRRLPVTLARNL
ncbi:hypothetical protein [Thermogutta sp.]|uniref:hypothetical protein n=1 Tax=Thermogutta sp. TaxID=1962930 RepID=UPI00321FE690